LGELSLWRVAMKPGKPLALGKIGNTPFLGLPGNPVSTFVTFALFARPFIRTMQGIRNACPRALPATAMFDWPKPGKRREYVRARRVQGDDKQLQIEIYPKQGSGVLTSTCWAEGLVEIREGTTVSPGDTVSYTPFSELIT